MIETWLERIEEVAGRETPDCPYCRKPTFIRRTWIRECLRCGRKFRLVEGQQRD